MPKRKKTPSSSSPKSKEATKPLPELTDELKEQLQTIIDTISDTNGTVSIKKLKKAIEKELGVFPLQSIDLEACYGSADPWRALERLVAVVWDRNMRADRCFDILDTEEKGVVVLQDLQKVAEDMLGDTVSESDLVEMLVEFNKDGIVTRQDFYRIASLVGL